MRALVIGLAVTGAATVRAMQRHGWTVVAADDRAEEGTARATVLAAASDLGVELVPLADVDALLDRVEMVSPSPGVPEDHPVVVGALRRGMPVWSEIELAYRWEQQRPGGPRPMLAVTGTDGKTTTTMLAAAMLAGAGRRTIAAGNTETPLLDALELPVDSFVVECTSFRLAWTEQFRADAAAWLNLAPDHLNWHRSMATYESAKARIFELQRPDDVAIGNADDPVVLRHLDAAPGRRLTFARRDADYRVDREVLTGPAGAIVGVRGLWRSLPHDVTNSLAAAALVIETGLAGTDAVATALGTFPGLSHRIEFVGERDGVRWFNDSKATTPHAASAAIHGFERVVLIAGGRNKGLDLSAMRPASRSGVELRGVVAIGEAAHEIAAAFDGCGTVTIAASMDDAVLAAASMARRGDAVLLSPGCASFDWYPDGGYPARGDHFRRLVTDLVLEPGASR